MTEKGTMTKQGAMTEHGNGENAEGRWQNKEMMTSEFSPFTLIMSNVRLRSVRNANNIKLYVWSQSWNADNIKLYVWSQSWNANNIKLYVWGQSWNANNIKLYVWGQS